MECGVLKRSSKQKSNIDQRPDYLGWDSFAYPQKPCKLHWGKGGGWGGGVWRDDTASETVCERLTRSFMKKI